MPAAARATRPVPAPKLQLLHMLGVPTLAGQRAEGGMPDNIFVTAALRGICVVVLFYVLFATFSGSPRRVDHWALALGGVTALITFAYLRHA